MRKPPPAVPRTALYALLTFWAGCSMLRQIDPSSKYIHRLDRMGLVVPNFRFFGPVPSVHDSHLLIRFHLGDGTTGPWRELICREKRRMVHMVWAPHRRMNKGLFDAQVELLTVIGMIQDMKRLSATIPYRTLLNLALHGVEHPTGARAAQFAIARSASHDTSVTPEIMFASDIHDLVNS